MQGEPRTASSLFIIQEPPCPFHSEGFQPTALDGGSQPFALAGPISTFGLDWGYQCPTPNRYPCFFPRKPSAFHSHGSTCQPTIGASLQPTALNRPHTQPANFTLSHIQSLSSFLSLAPNRHARNRAARASSHAVRLSSERRKWFLPCSGCSALVPRRRAASHRKGFVYFLSQALPRPLRSKASNPSAATDITTAHVADHIQPHSPAQYGRQCSQPTVRHRAPTQSLLTTLPRQRLSAFRCSAHLNPQALRRPRTQPHKPHSTHNLRLCGFFQPTPTRPALLAICPRQPPTAHP